MTKNKKTIYFIIFLLVILSDRATKFWAVSLGSVEKAFNKFLSFSLAYNRGVSWGLFSSSSSIIFILISFVTIAVTFTVLLYIIFKYRAKENIYGEVLVLSGAISNIIDRFYYSGVVDFILLKYKSYSWPLFNIADVAIVLGVIVMVLANSGIIQKYKKSIRQKV